MKTTVIQHTFEVGALVRKKGSTWNDVYEIEEIDLKKNGEITYRLKDMDIAWAEDELELAFPAFPIGTRVKVQGVTNSALVRKVDYSVIHEMYKYELEGYDDWYLERALEEVADDRYFVEVVGSGTTRYASNLTREEAEEARETVMLQCIANLINTPHMGEITCSLISNTIRYRDADAGDWHWVEFNIEKEMA